VCKTDVLPFELSQKRIAMVRFEPTSSFASSILTIIRHKIKKEKLDKIRRKTLHLELKILIKFIL
jgi:hypothetical protein